MFPVCISTSALLHFRFIIPVQYNNKPPGYLEILSGLQSIAGYDCAHTVLRSVQHLAHAYTKKEMTHQRANH